MVCNVNERFCNPYTVRPFEPSSTVVHPCTTVEGEFCARTKHRCCIGTTAILGSSGRIVSIFRGDIKKRSDAFTLSRLSFILFLFCRY